MTSVCVGNDIVDLRAPRTHGRASDARFLERVFDAPERHAITSARDADLELWCHWAAKEAGYKVISKLVDSPPPFVHRAFAVGWDSVPPAVEVDRPRPGDDQVIRVGRVRWGGHRARVWVAQRPGGVHAVAFASRAQHAASACVRPRVALLDSPESPWAGSLDDLMPLFTPREAEAVYSRPSAAVRLGARSDLAALIGVTERRLEIVCASGAHSRRPPRVLLDGEEAEADVSLSHDGRLVAWAVWVGSADRCEDQDEETDAP